MSDPQGGALARRYARLLALTVVPLALVILGLGVWQFQDQRADRLGELAHMVESQAMAIGAVADAAAKHGLGVRGSEALLAVIDQIGRQAPESGGRVWLLDSQGTAVGGMAQPEIPLAGLARGGGFRAMGDSWVMAEPISGTSWTLLWAMPSRELTALILPRFLPYFVILAALGLTVAVAQWLLQRQLVYPAMALVDQVRAEARGEPRPVPRLPEPWQGWARTIGEAFGARREIATITARFLAATESLGDGLAIWDAEDRLVYFNSRYPDHLTPCLRERIGLGVRFSDWIREGLAHGPIYHDDMGADFVERRLALRGQPVVEHEQHLYDGRWLHLRESRMEDGARVLLTRDITEERAQREALAEQSRKLEAVLASIAEGVTIVDGEGRVVLVNDGFLRMYGFPRELGRPGTRVEEFVRHRLLRGELRPGEVPGEDLETMVRLRARHLIETPSVELEESRPSGEVFRVRRQRLPDGLLVSTYTDITAEKQRERELRIFATAVEQAGDSVEITDAGYRLIFVNPAFTRLTGYAREEAIGRTPAELLRSDMHDAAFFAAIDRSLRQGRVWQGRLFSRHKDGHLVVQDATVSPLLDDAGEVTHFIAVKRDVSEQERAAQALRESEERYRAVVEAQTEFIIRQRPDGVITFTNEAFCRHRGKGREAMLAGYNDLEALPAAAAAQVRARWQELSPARPATTYDLRLARPDGSVTYEQWTDRAVFDEAGRLVEYQSVGRDITEQRRAEQALRASERLKEAVLEAALDCVVGIDGEGRIVEFNPAAERTFGFARADVLGRELAELLVPEPMRAAHRKGLRRHVAGGPSRIIGRRLQLSALHADGRELPVELVVVETPGHGAARYLAYMRDITEQRRAEEALRASEERFRTIVEDQLEFISRFGPDLRFTFVNLAYARHLGRAREAMIGTSVAELMTAAELERFTRQLAALTPEQPTVTYEMPGRDARGRERIEQWTDRALYDAEGDLVEYQSVGRDITDQREAERALRESEERYRAVVQDQTEVIGRFDANLKLVFANNAHCRLLGGRFEELLGTDFFYKMPEPLASDLRARIMALTPENPVDYGENEKILPDGRVRWFAWTNRALFDAEGRLTGYQAVGHDITEQKEAERALRESEAAMRVIAEGVPLPLAISRLDAPEILFINERAVESLGLGVGRQADALARAWVDLADRATLIRRATVEGRVDGFETRMRRVDGTMLWVLFSARTITYRGVPAFLSVMTDITERRAIEEALRASEARLAAFMQHAPVGVYLKTIDGRYVLANPEMSKVFGTAAERVVGKTVRDIVAPSDADLVEGYDLEVLSRGEATVHEEYLPWPGSYAWRMVIRFPIRDATGTITHIGGFDVDITTQKRAERALRESEQRFRQFAEAHPVPLSVLRLADDAVLFVNPAFLALFGLSQHEFEQLAKAELWADPMERLAYLARVREDGVVAAYEATMRRRDGRVFPASLSARLLEYGGEPAMVTSITDLTRQKDAEEQIARQRDALHQSEKLAALGALLAGVAHELNNPLSVVVGYSSMLAELSPDETSRRRAERVHAAAERCARIVKAFLAMARRKPPQFGPVALNEVVEAALELSGYGLRTADIEVIRKLDPDLPAVWGDSDQLHQVVANLIVNAQHALEQVSGPRRLLVRTRVRGRAVELVVGDNGLGMSEEVRKRIFEPFFTTKPQGIGTGVGLSLCHGIVTAHEGRIDVATVPGKGTRFKVRLPLVAAAPGESAVAAEEGAPAAQVQVLVVDDEAEIADLVREVLGREGYVVTVARSGHEALEALGRGAFAVIISDLRMPDLDGPGLWRELRARDPDLAGRMIFITGDTLGAEASRFLAEAEAPVMEKPLDLAELRRRVGEVAARA